MYRIYLYIGMTSLMYAADQTIGMYGNAAESRKTDTVKILVEYGADINTKDNSG